MGGFWKYDKAEFSDCFSKPCIAKRISLSSASSTMLLRWLEALNVIICGLLFCFRIHFPFLVSATLPLIAQVTHVGLIPASTPILNQRWDMTQVCKSAIHSGLSTGYKLLQWVQPPKHERLSSCSLAITELRCYPASLGTKLMWRKMGNEVLSSGNILWAPGSSPIWSSFSGNFQPHD